MNKEAQTARSVEWEVRIRDWGVWEVGNEEWGMWGVAEWEWRGKIAIG